MSGWREEQWHLGVFFQMYVLWMHVAWADISVYIYIIWYIYVYKFIDNIHIFFGGLISWHVHEILTWSWRIIGFQAADAEATNQWTGSWTEVPFRSFSDMMEISDYLGLYVAGLHITFTNLTGRSCLTPLSSLRFLLLSCDLTSWSQPRSNLGLPVFIRKFLGARIMKSMCRTTTGDVGKGGRWDVDVDGGPIPAPPLNRGMIQHECQFG